MRERGYVQMARMSGMKGWEIIFTVETDAEPVAVPRCQFRRARSGRRYSLRWGWRRWASARRPPPTMGMTIYWVLFAFNALIRGLWWWWLMPITFIVLLFISLFLISAGLDELANPRVRRNAGV